MCSYTESVNLDGKGRYFFGSIGPSLLERMLHVNHLDTWYFFAILSSDLGLSGLIVAYVLWVTCPVSTGWVA
jgi:hypothetical protein